MAPRLRLNVFISSTYKDLKEYRLRASQVLDRLGQDRIMMEVFGARPDGPEQVCFDEIDGSDLFLGLYAHRYGEIAPGSEISITEKEYNRAKTNGIPVLCFFVSNEYPWPPLMIDPEPGFSQLIAFKQRIQQSETVEYFTTLDDFGMKLATSTGRYLLKAIAPEEAETTIGAPGKAQLEDLVEEAISELSAITKTDYNQLVLRIGVDYSARLAVVADRVTSRKPRYRFASLSGIIGKSYYEEVTVNVMDVKNVDRGIRYIPAVMETRSELACPIPGRHGTLGVLNSESEEVAYFTEAKQTKVEALSRRLGRRLDEICWNPKVKEEDLPQLKEFRLPFL